MTVYGETAVVEQPRKHTWKPESGWQTLRRWRGSKDAILAYKADESLADASWVEIVENGASAVLSALFPYDQAEDVRDDTGDVVNVVFELEYRDLEKDLRTFPDFADNIGAAQFEEIEEAIRAGTAYALYAYPGWHGAYVRRRLKGVDTYLAVQPIIRQRIQVASRSAVKASISGILEVGSESPISGTPVSPGAVISQPKFSVPGNYEWLKKGPRVVIKPRGKFELIDEWWGAKKWDGILYRGGSATSWDT
jgi:hypothetical protein